MKAKTGMTDCPEQFLESLHPKFNPNRIVYEYETFFTLQKYILSILSTLFDTLPHIYVILTYV